MTFYDRRREPRSASDRRRRRFFNAAVVAPNGYLFSFSPTLHRRRRFDYDEGAFYARLDRRDCPRIGAFAVRSFVHRRAHPDVMGAPRDLRHGVNDGDSFSAADPAFGNDSTHSVFNANRRILPVWRRRRPTRNTVSPIPNQRKPDSNLHSISLSRRYTAPRAACVNASRRCRRSVPSHGQLAVRAMRTGRPSVERRRRRRRKIDDADHGSDLHRPHPVDGRTTTSKLFGGQQIYI